MDYNTWSRYEAVPLGDGIIARRTGLHYMKSHEEINAYYLERFGTYWFNTLPKTDNTYSPTSKYHGCTLAPGIPLIPNLCRRPLRSPNSEYEYTFNPVTFTPNEDDIFYAKANNHHNSWVEKNNVINNGTSTNHNHIGQTRLQRQRLDFQDSGLDSDSDFEDSNHIQLSQNTVTWFSWIITTITTVLTIVKKTVTTVVTSVKETVVGRQESQNHVNTRVPLNQSGGVSWYQYPVLWLYTLGLWVHRADVWVLYKVNSVLNVDSWGTPQQRRKWALIILLIPLILFAGYKLVEWLLEEESESEGWLLYPFFTAWESVSGFFFNIWNWFDGSWISAPWVVVADWIEEAAEDVPVEEATEGGWSAFWTWPLESASALLASLGGLVGSVFSSLGEGAVVVYTTIVTFLSALFNWLMECVTSVPALCSSALMMAVHPFTLISWESKPVDYTTSAPQYSSDPTPEFYSTSSAPAPPPSLELLLRDKQLLSVLVRHLLSSQEFDRAMAERQSSNQQKVDLAVDSAFSAALSKINLQFSEVKDELNGKIASGESSVETKMDALKQQIQELQLALAAHKALVSEQAALSSRLEVRINSAEQIKMQDSQEQAKMKEQILLEVAKVKEEMVDQLESVSLNQKVVVDSGNFTPTPTTELEAFVNSTVERLLAIYDADKIAKVDFALASSGGSVLNVRCTETFSMKNAQYLVWGYPLWSKPANDPRVALQPSMNPGECWAFTGSQGYMVIELSDNITVTGFTLEHLPRSLSPSGTIDTAPRDFHVLGLESENDDMPILLGKFRYEDNGVSLQHFEAQPGDHGFKIVELVIESNHGNLEYTCLYRFRVHGKPVRQT